MKEFLDEIGGRYIVQRVKQMINAVEADSVTKQELQAELDALHINIDLSSYATKEELTQAINSIDLSAYAKKTDIPSLEGYVTETELNAKGYLTEHQDLSAYALKTEIPSLDGLATTEYVDNAIANVPSGGGGNVDLSNYYTKDEVYSKSETDALIPTVTNGVDGITPHIDETTKHWMIGDTDTGILAEGTNGTNGDNGVSPTVSVTETTNGHTVAITDVNSTQSFDVTNGTNGTNGVSPTVTVTKEGKVATITCTDVNGTTTATISDGADGQGGGDSSSSGGSSNVYSTTETAIGTWIDGSTIYRKVIEYGILGSVSSGNQGKINISFGETIEKIINASALISHTNGTQMVVNGAYESAILVPTTSSVSNYANQIEQKKMSFVSTSKTSITFYYGTGYASYDATFIVEYTKPAQTS